MAKIALLARINNFGNSNFLLANGSTIIEALFAFEH